VPLILLLCVEGMDLAWSCMAFSATQCEWRVPPMFGADILSFGLSCLSLIYVIRFAEPNPLNQLPWTEQSSVMQNLQQVCGAIGVSFLGTSTWQGIGEQMLMVCTPLVALGMVLWRCNLDRFWRSASLWLVLMLGLFLTFLFAPHNLSGAFYVTDRLLIILWLAALLSATDQPVLGRAQLHVLIGCVVAAVALTIVSVNGVLRPVARTIESTAQLENHSIKGQVGVLVAPSQRAAVVANDLAYMPYAWAGIHYFRHNEAILYNASWLQHRFFPLGTHRRSPISFVSIDVGSPMALLIAMSQQEAIQQMTAQDAKFAVLFDPMQGEDLLRPLIRSTSFSKRHWRCSSMATPWLTQCYGRDNPPSSLWPGVAEGNVGR
jgi:hypothetical protein